MATLVLLGLTAILADALLALAVTRIAAWSLPTR